MTLRRAIANAAPANVRFGSFPQLAEWLAMRRLALEGLRGVVVTYAELLGVL